MKKKHLHDRLVVVDQGEVQVCPRNADKKRLYSKNNDYQSRQFLEKYPEKIWHGRFKTCVNTIATWHISAND